METANDEAECKPREVDARIVLLQGRVAAHASQDYDRASSRAREAPPHEGERQPGDHAQVLTANMALSKGRAGPDAGGFAWYSDGAFPPRPAPSPEPRERHPGEGATGGLASLEEVGPGRPRG
jgi:hypothetical protein